MEDDPIKLLIQELKKEDEDSLDIRATLKVILEILQEVDRNHVPPKDGDPGKDADEEYIIESVLQRLPKPEKINTEDLIRAVIARIPRPKDIDEEGILNKIIKLVPVPQDGKDADEERVVMEVLKKIPSPKEPTPIEVFLLKVKEEYIESLQKRMEEFERFTKGNFDVRIGVSKTELKALQNRVTTLESSSSSGGLSLLTATGTVDGSNTSFTFATAPSIIVVDQGRMMQQVSSDGTVNWTGTTSVSLTVAPQNDVYGL